MSLYTVRLFNGVFSDVMGADVTYLYSDSSYSTSTAYFDAALTQPVSRFPVPRKAGYVFNGYWYYNDPSPFIDSDGNLNLALWNYRNSYAARYTQTATSVTLDRNDGTGDTSGLLWKKIGDSSNIYGAGTCDDPVTHVSIPIRRGYHFSGYYTLSDGGTKCIEADGEIVVSASGMPDTVYAHWEDADSGSVMDWFCLASHALVPVASDSGDIYKRDAVAHYGKYESEVNATSKKWRNPTVTYVVKDNTTVSVRLGQAFSAVFSSGVVTCSGYMVTTVEIATEIGKFPTVTVSAVANEGANSINNFSSNVGKFDVAVQVVARSKAQNLLGAISGGGYLQRVTLMGTCDPVVCEENLMPCASDIVNGRFELAAETLAANGEAAPTMAAASGTSGGFALTGVPRVWRDCDFIRYAVEARKEMV